MLPQLAELALETVDIAFYGGLFSPRPWAISTGDQRMEAIQQSDGITTYSQELGRPCGIVRYASFRDSGLTGADPRRVKTKLEGD